MCSSTLSTDSHRRLINYLRISITDECDERCIYCLPERIKLRRLRGNILADEEILAVVETAVSMGFCRFRLTGGEPLARDHVDALVQRMTAIPGVTDIGLSTNGLRLAKHAQSLAQAGLSSANISLDALDPSVYEQITGGHVKNAIRGLEALQATGVPRIKLNTVLIRGITEDQIRSLLEFAGKYNVPIRFIELMPVSRADMIDARHFLSVSEAKALIEARASMVPEPAALGFGPAVYYRVPSLGVTVGFIGAMTNPRFCDTCNRMRLTADGTLRPCLGHPIEYDLKPALRPRIKPHSLRQIFDEALRNKPHEHQFQRQFRPERFMTSIGG